MGDTANASLVYSTHMSPPRDDLALELYQRALSQLECAYPVCMNDAGDYFRIVLDTLKGAAAAYLPTISKALSFIPSPYAQAGSALAAGAAGMVDPGNFKSVETQVKAARQRAAVMGGTRNKVRSSSAKLKKMLRR